MTQHDRLRGHTFTTRFDEQHVARVVETRRKLCVGEEVTVISREQYLQFMEEESKVAS